MFEFLIGKNIRNLVLTGNSFIHSIANINMISEDSFNNSIFLQYNKFVCNHGCPYIDDCYSRDKNAKENGFAENGMSIYLLIREYLIF